MNEAGLTQAGLAGQPTEVQPETVAERRIHAAANLHNLTFCRNNATEFDAASSCSNVTGFLGSGRNAVG